MAQVRRYDNYTMSERQGNENTWYTNDEYLDRINNAYSVFEVVEPINVKAGKIAPWFDESGGGILRRIK